MKHVMVVDDTPDTLEVTAQILKMKGFKVSTFDNAKKALENLKQIKNIDLLLLDMRMPEMSGLDFAQAVREDPIIKDTKIVFFTASSELDKSLLKKHDVLGYLFKPFDIDSLVSQVNAFIGK